MGQWQEADTKVIQNGSWQVWGGPGDEQPGPGWLQDSDPALREGVSTLRLVHLLEALALGLGRVPRMRFSI